MGVHPGSISDQVPEHTDAAAFARQKRDAERLATERAAERRLASSTIGNGGTLVVEGTLSITGDLEVPAGTLSSSGNMTAGVDVVAGRDVLAGRNVNATGDSTAVGTGSFATGLTSLGAAGLDLSTIGGSRQAAWQLVASGRYGFAPSTLASKTNLSESLPFTAEDVYATIPFVYEYIGQVAIRDDPENPEYDPAYVVPVEIGLIADYLIAHNMSIFVVFNEDGTPRTIDYAAFGAVANLVAVRDLNERLKAAGL